MSFFGRAGFVMNESNQPFVESFWFTAVMSAVSVAMLGEQTVSLFSGDMRNLIGISIWLMIAYHFMHLNLKYWQRPKSQA